MTPSAPALAALVILVVWVGLATGCSDDSAILYQHDGAKIRLEEPDRLVIDVGTAPKAVIDSQHRLFIGGSRVSLDPAERAEIARYYDSVTQIRDDGWDTGRAGAGFALETIKTVASKLVSGDVDTIEQTIEAKKQTLLASVNALCATLGRVVTAQRQLASNVPDFRPYAVVAADDVDDCHREVAQNRASH